MGEDVIVDGFVNLLGTPPSRDPVIENLEVLYSYGQYGFDHN